jgi:hypothetical protein
MSAEKISSIVKETGIPRVGVLIPDGTRKIGVICYSMDCESPDFEKNLFRKVNEDLMTVANTFFEHGLHTLFVPCLTNGNLKRDKDYVENAVNIGLQFILKSEPWLNFYREHKIRVKIYGDINLFEKLGYNHVLKWVEDIQEETAQNDRHVLFFGLGCSNREENDRIMDHAIDFYRVHNRKPSREELVNWYYNGPVDEVDFFIRPTIIRDSDVQPPLISGVKTQMYFPIAPFPFLDKNGIREIFYDMLYTRTISMGFDNEILNGLNPEESEIVKDYYMKNRSVIFGVGKRIGDFWLPVNNIKIPPKLEKED